LKLYFNVKFVDGQWQATNMPRIRDGAVAELAIEDIHLNDPRFESARRDALEVVLDVTEGVLVHLKAATTEPVSNAKVKGTLPGGFCSIVYPSGPIRVVKKPGQRPRLQAVEVQLLDLGKAKATSLNDACTKLSERFETTRQSHTYSAFEVVYLCRNKTWIPLKDLI
jgi:hypothetical protein